MNRDSSYRCQLAKPKPKQHCDELKLKRANGMATCKKNCWRVLNENQSDCMNVSHIECVSCACVCVCLHELFALAVLKQPSKRQSRMSERVSERTNKRMNRRTSKQANGMRQMYVCARLVKYTDKACSWHDDVYIILCRKWQWQGAHSVK